MNGFTYLLCNGDGTFRPQMFSRRRPRIHQKQTNMFLISLHVCTSSAGEVSKIFCMGCDSSGDCLATCCWIRKTTPDV